MLLLLFFYIGPKLFFYILYLAYCWQCPESRLKLEFPIKPFN